MQPFISHQSIISVLLLNSASRCQALVKKVQQSKPIHTKRVYFHVRRRASTSVYARLRRVDHPMASDLVARDKVVNIQFIK